MKTKMFSDSWLIISLLIVALCGAIGSAKVIYVDASATGDNNGSNWTNAYNYLQDALVSAASYGAEIRAAQGIYRPDQGGGNVLGDRSATFQLRNGVTIKGGYAGLAGTDPNERDVDSYNTILSGDLDGDDKKVTELSELGYDSTRNENSYIVVTGSATNGSAIIDGCTITGGNAYPFDSGAGMYNETGSPTVKNCSFIANSAYYGGGMCNKYESKPKVYDCYFAGNYAYWGGGMANVFDSDPSLEGCEFDGNGAIEGAGIANISGSSPYVQKCMFQNNSARLYGGGIQNDHVINPCIEKCTFKQNSAVSSGGGIKCDNETEAEIIDCTFSGNTARYGAGVYCGDESEPILINCIFTGNVGLEDAGGLSNTGGSKTKLYNCLFSGNTARFGGVIYNASSIIRLTNCTMAGNTATSGHGNAFSCRASDGPGEVTVKNSIIWDGGREIETWGNGNTEFFITSTDVQGWVPSTGNINLDPFFVRYPDDGGDGWGDDSTTPDVDESENDDFGDLHLMEISPCINSGDNSAIPSWLEVDLDGGPRIIDLIVDRGAYEYEKPAPVPQNAPIADAGDDQTVYAWVDDIAQVTLDGSKSSDPDSDKLTYRWTWTIEEEDFEATGVSPKIDLPPGEHTIQLIVNDGIEDSPPDFVTIIVIEPIRTFLSVYPQPIVRSSSAMQYIYTVLNLDDILPGEVDKSQPILLYPGAAEPVALYINPDFSGDGTTIFAIYKKQDLLDALPEDGEYELKVVGQLNTGPYFYGFYPVRIIE
jgi:predicted outer membrane repeat protein